MGRSGFRTGAAKTTFRSHALRAEGPDHEEEHHNRLPVFPRQRISGKASSIHADIAGFLPARTPIPDSMGLPLMFRNQRLDRCDVAVRGILLVHGVGLG